ncbi:hypothetical protein BGW36DRAFT_442375 [Talaromyces proteolyticus]|uniref:ubiquitinyl hydrolase 1 n=1 Tax=Talaromyces proteolyticus TaxID=1131652 RepID=A0AAD4KGR2_9EURO|nr:uncharacterized protein BGW36DRAFT_442375 [Talaromyces proteolyticus]KAH8689142.1 hypothetical protein BGW36DRAFT_442375 [Talaromyces proteolyticus]
MDQSSASTGRVLSQIINHIALPPKLPGRREDNLAFIDENLAKRLRDSCRILRDYTRDEISHQWDTLCSILQTCRKLNTGGRLENSRLLTEFALLESRHLLILHVTEQNAGLLIRRDVVDSDEVVVFEAFEVSSTAEAALKTPNALVWNFPGCAVALPYSEFRLDSFQQPLAFFLQQASVESIKNFAVRADKAGSSAAETRETVSPILITDMLMTLIEANGRRLTPILLQKRVRDEVDWQDRSECPWRRSPYWLLLRVAVQRHLYALYGAEIGRVYYKFLICIVLSELIHDAIDSTDPGLLQLLRAKLSRRLTKLEVDKGKGSQDLRDATISMFTTFRPVFDKSLEKISQAINQTYEAFKRKVQKTIPRIRRDADARDITLSLSSSGAYLDSLLSSYRATTNTDFSRPLADPSPADFSKEGTAAQFQNFSARYCELFELEEEAKELRYADKNNQNDPSASCIDLANKINHYLDTVGNAYHNTPEQKSVMILTVMRLWMLMDISVTEAFPLLKAYHPGIHPGSLDVLHLPHYIDMLHLNSIQSYLNRRRSSSHGRTIFENPSQGCFAERYFDESEDSQKMHQTRADIEYSAEGLRLAKLKEWEELSVEYEDLQHQIARASCIYITDDRFGTIHDDKHCTKCYLQRRARRMKIGVVEHPLPDDEVSAKAVIFELLCPNAIRAYRNGTWRIIGEVGQPSRIKGKEPLQALFDYGPLQPFIRGRYKSGVSLASVTKSFLLTHYKEVRLPIDQDSIFLPNGFKLRYYDSQTGVWTGSQTFVPSFLHHCHMSIPATSPFLELQQSLKAASATSGPTSYEVVASQGKCPSGLNVHEFTAYQNLFAGHSRRWPNILIELGASNLNFSTEATALLLSYLTVQAGPADSNDPLREAHKIFRDKTFCETLIHQITKRLENISGNWRETNCMSMLLTLILRLYAIGPGSVRANALNLVGIVRETTFNWIRALRLESTRTNNSEITHAASMYAFIVALICKRTFIYIENKMMDSSTLSCFIECSITLQDNMIGDLEMLPPYLWNSLINDVKMVHNMRDRLRSLFLLSPGSLTTAIKSTWLQRNEDEMSFLTKMEPVQHDCNWWFRSDFRASAHSRPQTLHYHLLAGHLLIDGAPIGKLPSQYRSLLVFERLFGKQPVVVIPSGLPGMTYMVPFPMENHQIHMGFRDKRVFMRACFGNNILELISPSLFHGSSGLDLPADLIENCLHWLNLNTGVIEIRKAPDIWISKFTCWRLDVPRRIARRKDKHTLVDPRSPTFVRIARIFKDFEPSNRVTMFQAEKGLNIDLRRLELSFWVANGLLRCRQLGSEIDPNQDAGTMYGLQSKLVIRDIKNPNKRSILVPLGDIEYDLIGNDVSVTVKNQGDYGRFQINDMLGRLDCPAEPRLLYFKAQLHAYTSLVVPDPLTGRTGSEEALQFLSSGICQPWAPISQGPARILLSISRLSPRRGSYQGLRTMQTVDWDPKLSTDIQKDEFRKLTHSLFEKSKILTMFHPRKGGDISTENEDFDLECDQDQLHLQNRSIWRRRLYERTFDVCATTAAPQDIIYGSRDRDISSQAHLNVYIATTLLRNWHQSTFYTSSLSSIFSNWSNIGGFDKQFSDILLSDQLNVDLAKEFGALVKLGRNSKRNNTYKLMFLFGSISFKDNVDMSLVRTLISFVTIDDLKVLEPPSWPLYSYFRPGDFPTIYYLKRLIEPCRVPYPDDERKTFGTSLHSKVRRKLEAAEREYQINVDSDCEEFIESLLKQWPCREPDLETLGNVLLIDISRALDIIKPEWLRMFQNYELSQYVERIQKVLNDRSGSFQVVVPPYKSTEEITYLTRFRGSEVPALYDLLSMNVQQPLGLDKIKGHTFSHVPDRKTVNSALNPELIELQNIIKELSGSTSTVERTYAEDLMRSLRSLHDKFVNATDIATNSAVMPYAPAVAKESFQFTQYMQSCFHGLDQLLQDDYRSGWLLKGGLWPCITPVNLLRCLASEPQNGYGPGMKERLIRYGEAVTWTQRLLRLEDSVLRQDDQRVREEMMNTGHENWDIFDHPLWLLLEIESNILIRKDQIDVAFATMNPSSGSNSVLQMNMGQGKTSCIMPMVVAELADKEKLVRVIVPKALLLQTAQLMQSRLGGLLDRQVRHLPFSRKTPTNEDTIQTYSRVHTEMMRSSGVMIALPEHILSFMLSGLQRLSDGRHKEAYTMIKTQNSLRKVCRDVLDESDVTLSTRTQLIYPSGTQASVDGYPYRWETSEMILRLVARHLWYLQKHLSRSIEVYERPQGGLPLVFFLRSDAEDALIKLLVDDVIRGYIPALSMRGRTDADCLAIKKFISDPSIDSSTRSRINRVFGEQGSAKQTLYLLRGLFVHRILLLTLKKRYNVQYGLHPDRDPIAVPYHAKGVPSEQAEWGHPDVAILFTCLSFYFGGLEIQHLRQSLSHVLKSDDPASGYDKWTEGSMTLPDSLREWNNINIDDEVQLHEIWTHLRLDMSVIDYYLNHFVFPRHAKQFDVKLQANGWDIPLFSTRSSPRNITTGFSGTNDNKTMLPLTIQQRDLDALSHTNAEVLTYLLQPRNRGFVVASDALGKRINERNILNLLYDLKLRIFIDAGAQILEMDNLTLAKTWLTIYKEAPAAVYFDSENRPFVLYKQGNRLPLSASSYADNLSECLIYLDEAHTRGTDLKLPADARGALTLGLGQTKDHTVQGKFPLAHVPAMRLRQLATTQSVTFIAPPEVYHSILDYREKTVGQRIDSHDVVSWLLKQTASGIEQMQPLYFAHGMDFCQRIEATSRYPNFLRSEGQRDEYLRVLRQAEKQTLEQLYAPKTQRSGSPLLGSGTVSKEIAEFIKELKSRRKAFRDSGSAVHSSALQEVEQEREVAFEVEAVREVQKPVKFHPLKFPGLHSDIVRFVETGRLALESTGVEKAFMALKRTSIGRKYGITSHATNTQLYVSNEFMRTVQLPENQPNDNLIRPVTWILWSIVTQKAIVIIPEEAEIIIPLLLRNNPPSGIYLLTYSAPLTRTMAHFSDLSYYSIPSLPSGWQPPVWLKVELGILAGRVYFEFDEYPSICDFLGIRVDQKVQESTPIEMLESVIEAPQDLMENHSNKDVEMIIRDEESTRKNQTFTEKPLLFLQEWIAVRRRGQDFTHTPMGYVCQGKPLDADHPFFSKRERSRIEKPSGAPRGNQFIEPETVEDADVDDFELVDDFDFDEDMMDED